MALDSFDRVASLNAVVEAWTRYGCAPFITHKTLGTGESFDFHVSADSCIVFATFGRSANSQGLKFTTFASGAATTKNIAAASEIGYVRSGNTFTVTNNAASYNVDVFIIALKGSAEEV